MQKYESFFTANILPMKLKAKLFNTLIISQIMIFGMLISLLACHGTKSVTNGKMERPIFAFVGEVTFEDVKALAKEQDKAIFIDFYTDWCGACKEVDKEIFLGSPSAATFYNTNFVNYKVDAESTEGVALVKRYKVRGYPTYIFCNAAGVLLLRKFGKPNYRDFIRMGESALHKLEENDR